MSATQEILFGVTGQTLVVEVDRPISSVTSVSVWPLDADDTSTAEAATTGSAAVDSTTEVTTAAITSSTADRAKLTVASTTGFVAGRRYLISKSGRSEVVEVEAIDTDALLYLRHPLTHDYATGATINGSIRATISVDNTWAADLNNLSPTADPNPGYRVRWVLALTDPTETVVELRNFDLVRYPARCPVTWIDVDDANPGWRDALATDHRDSLGQRLLMDAVREVRLDLYHRGIADQGLRNAEVFSALVIDRAIYGAIENNAKRGSDRAIAALPFAKDAYDRRLAGLVDSPRLALDTSGGGAAPSGGPVRADRLLRR